jgi:hypothetical protein
MVPESIRKVLQAYGFKNLIKQGTRQEKKLETKTKKRPSHRGGADGPSLSSTN